MDSLLFSSSPFNFNQIQASFDFGGDYEKDQALLINPDSQENQPQSSIFLNQFNINPIPQPTTIFNPSPSSLSSLKLLKNYSPVFKKLKRQRNRAHDTNTTRKSKLSTEEIMRSAGAKFINSSLKRVGTAGDGDGLSVPMHPYGAHFSGVSDDDQRDIELAVLLLAAAEKIGNQQFDRGSKLLTHCQWIASQKANTVQKIVFHFAGALRMRIDKETGEVKNRAEIDDDDRVCTKISCLSCYLQIPFIQVMQFTGVQSIMETIAFATKIHLVDLEIRSGVQWTVLMAALADRKDRPIQRLTITAIGARDKPNISETGRRLVSFAESKNLPFSFKTVFVSDIEEIREEMFEIEEDETVAIYSLLMLKTLISRPNCLENLMGVIKNLYPSIMVVIEVEANHTSPAFVDRFTEALFYYSAYFDCLEACMEERDEHRAVAEALFGDGIRNIVGTEGTERTARSVKVEVWRAFFRRFGMVEIGFSESSQYQASLVAKRFGRGGSCTLEKNGKCMVVGWKGTPVNSVSAWKFR